MTQFIFFSGKGGVGKTTIAGTLARMLADDNYKVMAIDADPDANLASALGCDPEVARGITPIADMKDFIRERTGAGEGYGVMFKQGGLSPPAWYTLCQPCPRRNRHAPPELLRGGSS